MDRVYKGSIPAAIKDLVRLKLEFARLEPKTDWTELRIKPLLSHAKQLDRLLKSRRFSGEIERLRRGVEMFHADLVYFRDNIRGLEKLLQKERKAAGFH